MPIMIVQRAMSKLPVREDTAGGIRALASGFWTSVSATLEHIGNLKRWDEDNRERVRSEVTDSQS